MKKNYRKPRLSVENMNFSLLVQTSNIYVGGSGTLDSKANYQYIEDEDVEGYYE